MRRAGQSKAGRLASSKHHVPSADELIKFSLLFFARAIILHFLENQKGFFSMIFHPINSVAPPLQKNDLAIGILQKI